jgi:hypothetical protein
MGKFVRLSVCCLAGLSLLGVFGVAVVHAAEPEWGRCVAQNKGGYADSNCQTPSVNKKTGLPNGNYEWFPGAGATCVPHADGGYTDAECKTVNAKHKGKYEMTVPLKFSGTTGGTFLLADYIYSCENAKGAFIGPLPKADCATYRGVDIPGECKSVSISGEPSGLNEVKSATERFKECTIDGRSGMTTPGLSYGEVETKKLKGKLGYTNKAGKSVGLLLEPETSGGPFLEFEWTGGHVTVGEGNATQGSFYEELGPGDPTGRDGFISTIGPVDSVGSIFSLSSGIDAYSGEPSPSAFEDGPRESLEAQESQLEFQSEWGPFAWENGSSETMNETAEIKA